MRSLKFNSWKRTFPGFFLIQQKWPFCCILACYGSVVHSYMIGNQLCTMLRIPNYCNFFFLSYECKASQIKVFTAVLHRGLRNDFFSLCLFTFSNFYLPFLFGFLFTFSFGTFIFPFLFGLLYNRIHILDFFQFFFITIERNTKWYTIKLLCKWVICISKI